MGDKTVSFDAWMDTSWQDDEDDAWPRGTSTPAIQERLKCACHRLEACACAESRAGIDRWDEDHRDQDREECECACHWQREE